MLGGAKLLRWTVIDSRHRPTGNCQHVVAGVLEGPAAGLAICRSDEEGAYYFFGCDAQWNTVTDSWRETLEDAMRQAEFEYEGVAATWNVI